MPALTLGLMSGTSCDGISAAIAQFHRRRVRVIAERTIAYPERFARVLRRASTLSVAELSSLNMALGEQFARAALAILNTSDVPTRRIEVIGSHGHTVYHGPHDRVPSTLQLGEPSIIAERTGLPVVANFRPRDLAAGGEGAPLVPYFDEMFFGGGQIRALQNLGGIANVSVVGRGLSTIAFDTGPGNSLIDLVTQQITHNRQRFDAHGHLALRGRIDHRAVDRLWRHPYFRLPPPKSTGRELFNETLLQHVFGSSIKRAPCDVLATVTYFTAYSIVESYRRFIRHRLREILVSGGGVRNRTLMHHLTKLLAPVPVRSIEHYGIPPQAKEPVAFGFLALQTIRGRVNHLPQTTGARAARILGTITPGGRSLRSR